MTRASVRQLRPTQPSQVTASADRHEYRPRIVVVGDLMLDADIDGVASRLSPEAPVPVVDVVRQTQRPGGAGLAAVLAARAGAEVHLVAPMGEDPDGIRVRELLEGFGVRTTALPMDGSMPVKQRVRVGEQAMLRLDVGRGRLAPDPLPDAAGSALIEILDQADAVLVSDYGGGTTSHREVREALTSCSGSVPLVWDPHPRGSRPVSGTLIATPNVDEARAVVGSEMPRDDWVGILDLASAITRTWSVRAACVTAGARGAVLSYPGRTPIAVPSSGVARADACGAGDCLSASLATSLGRGELLMDAVVTAVPAARGFVADGGVARLARQDEHVSSISDGETGQQVADRVRGAGGTVVATGGCFDLLHSGHIATLSAARKVGDCLIVLMNSDESVRALKGAGRPLVPEHDRARVLRELACVDAVVIFEETRPDAVLRSIRPDVWVKGGDYAIPDIPERQTLEEWGGRIVTVPYLPGRSTSALVQAARSEVAS